MWYSEEMKVFIKGPNPNVEKALEPHAKFTYDDIINKYESSFKRKYIILK
jgi:hypothetical protein